MAVRRRTLERFAAGLAAVVAMAVVLVAPVHLSGGRVALGDACADASTAQVTVAVGVVVDFGVLKGAGDPGGQVVTCVPVAPRSTNGFRMLEAAGHVVRVDDSGLLCAIDGQPETGCGDRTPTGYRYWAYFQGDGSSWRYSSVGPGSSYAAAGKVEGWHFVEGAGNPSDPPPRRAPTDICPVTPPPTNPAPTVPPVAPTDPPPTTAPSSGGGGGSPSTPSPNAGGGAAPSGGGNPSPSPTTVAGGASTITAPDGGGEPAPGAEPADPNGTTVDPSTTADGTGSSPTGTAVEGSSTDVTMLAAAIGPTASETGGAPVATIVGIAVIVGVGAAAAWKLRSRSGDLA